MYPARVLDLICADLVVGRPRGEVVESSTLLLRNEAAGSRNLLHTACNLHERSLVLDEGHESTS